jgi:hypothetical protein
MHGVAGYRTARKWPTLVRGSTPMMDKNLITVVAVVLILALLVAVFVSLI